MPCFAIDGADRFRQRLDIGPREIGVALEKRKRAFLRGQFRRRGIGRIAHDPQPALDQPEASGRAVTRAAEDERVREARDAKPDAALLFRLAFLRRQRKARNVDDVVEEAHGHARELCQLGLVQPRFLRERTSHQLGEIDRTQQARAVGRQRLLAARIGRVDRLAIGKIVERVDAVDEDDAGLGGLIGRDHDPVPQRARRNRAVHGAVEDEVPGTVLLHRRHERVGRPAPRD